MNGIQDISTTSFVMNTQSTDETKGRDRFLNDAAKVLGLTADELRTELESGKDLEQIITDKGLTMDDFQQGLNGLRDKADSFQNAPPPPPPGKGPEQFFTDASEVLGISSDELKTELESGNDLQTIIKEQGLTMEDFQQQLATLFNSHQSANVDQIGNIFDEEI